VKQAVSASRGPWREGAGARRNADPHSVVRTAEPGGRDKGTRPASQKLSSGTDRTNVERRQPEPGLHGLPHRPAAMSSCNDLNVSKARRGHHHENMPKRAASQ
jgi:hypothetical protein